MRIVRVHLQKWDMFIVKRKKQDLSNPCCRHDVNVMLVRRMPGNIYLYTHPDSKVHEANMGPIWGRQDPGEPHVDPMNFAIWAHIYHNSFWMISTQNDWIFRPILRM